MSARIILKLGNYIGIVRKVYQEVLSRQSITVSIKVDNTYTASGMHPLYRSDPQSDASIITIHTSIRLSRLNYYGVFFSL